MTAQGAEWRPSWLRLCPQEDAGTSNSRGHNVDHLAEEKRDDPADFGRRAPLAPRQDSPVRSVDQVGQLAPTVAASLKTRFPTYSRTWPHRAD